MYSILLQYHITIRHTPVKASKRQLPNNASNSVVQVLVLPGDVSDPLICGSEPRRIPFILSTYSGPTTTLRLLIAWWRWRIVKRRTSGSTSPAQLDQVRRPHHIARDSEAAITEKSRGREEGGKSPRAAGQSCSTNVCVTASRLHDVRSRRKGFTAVSTVICRVPNLFDRIN